MHGKENVRDQTFYQLTPELSADDHLISCSDTYYALPYKGGGGPVYCSRINDFGKVVPECGVLNGHKGPVQATSFSPFHSSLLATASADCTVKIWNLDHYEDYSDEDSKARKPFSECLTLAGDTVQPLMSFDSHRNSVRSCDFHNTIPNLLVTTSLDGNLKFFDVNECKEVSSMKIVGDVADDGIQLANISFSYDGSLLSVSCKGNYSKIALIDPRAGKVILESQNKIGRNLRVLWCSTGGSGSFDPLLSVSSNTRGGRQIMLWDPRNMEKPILEKPVDSGAGQLLPMYDEGLRTVYMTGKGDTILRAYEFITLPPLNAADLDNPSESDLDAPAPPAPPSILLEKGLEFMASPQEPIAGICMLPKRTCDVKNVEVSRFLKLSTNTVTPISFRVPRADHLKGYFHDDVFPPTRSKHSELSVDDWLSPDTPLDLFSPKLESLKDGLIKEDGSVFKSVSEIPPEAVVAPSNTKSKISQFKDEIEKNEQESKVREDRFLRLQNMAAQNAKFNANKSGPVKIGGVVVQNNNEGDDSSSDGGWSDEDS